MPASSNSAASGAPFVLTPTASVANLPVVGNGTPGRLTKWTGFTSSNSAIGDSNIYEDKFGKVGIGTTVPTSLLTVQGVIETFGGVKFGDGTTQTTSAAGALFGVAHNATLQGNGTTASPLGIAVPLSLTGSVAVGALLTAANSGLGDGVSGSAQDGAGVRGRSDNGAGVEGNSNSSQGVRGVSTSGVGVVGGSNTGGGVFGSTINGIGVRGLSNTGAGVSGFSINGFGISGESDTSAGVYAKGGTQDSFGAEGVLAKGGDGNVSAAAGIFSQGGDAGDAIASGGAGVSAFGGTGSGAGSVGGYGLIASGGAGINGAAPGLAGTFNGDVNVTGKLTKTMGTFKIDHPLDPENKYLYHSFVESPDMMNIYNGNITTDSDGEAVVEMPEYFDALNKDFRYQLTVIGTFAQAIVATRMKDNRFVIRTSSPNVDVSWQVTGVRRDSFANKNRVQVEENKSERERGYYLHPEVFDQSEEKSVEWARHPELMLKLKQQRLEAEAKINKQQPR